MIGFGSSGGAKSFSVTHVQVVALYDPKDGRIKHMHVVSSMSGAKPVSQEEAIAQAKERASKRHENVEHLAIALSNDGEHANRSYRIDLKTKAFVPLTSAVPPKTPHHK